MESLKVPQKRIVATASAVLVELSLKLAESLLGLPVPKTLTTVLGAAATLSYNSLANDLHDLARPGGAPNRDWNHHLLRAGAMAVADILRNDRLKPPSLPVSVRDEIEQLAEIIETLYDEISEESPIWAVTEHEIKAAYAAPESLKTLSAGDAAVWAGFLHSVVRDSGRALWFNQRLIERMAKAIEIQFHAQLFEVLKFDFNNQNSPLNGGAFATMQLHLLRTAVAGNAQNAELLEGLLHQFRALISQQSVVPSEPPSRRLPAQTEKVFGRTTDIKRIRKLLKSQRLVTIHGPPCTGKTTVALEVLRSYTPNTPVFFIDLSNAQTSDGIAVEMLQNFGRHFVEGSGSQGNLHLMVGEVLDGIGDAVVALDNFEQVAAFAEQSIGTWRRHAPAVRFLVTSRCSLPMESAYSYELKPLAFEILTDHKTLESFIKSAACRLFLHVAKKKGYRIDPHKLAEISIVSRICSRTGGFPAVIELAAGRLSRLSLEELESSIKGVFQNRSRSYDVNPKFYLFDQLEGIVSELDREQRNSLLQCSMFRGGFRLDAAAQVLLNSAGEAINDLETVEAHIRKFQWLDLVTLEDDKFEIKLRCKRYRFYLPVEEWLEERWHLEIVHDLKIQQAQSMARYYAGLFENLAFALATSEHKQARMRMRGERENLIQAITYCTEFGDIPLAARCVLAIAPYMAIEGPAARLAQLIEGVLQNPQALDTNTHARLTRDLLIARWNLGNWDGKDSAVVLAEKALSLAIESKDLDLVHDLDLWHCRLQSDQGAIKRDQALRNYKSISIATQASPNRNVHLRATMYLADTLGWTSKQQEALETFLQIEPEVRRGSPPLLARLLNAKGLLHWRNGRNIEAVAALTEAAELNSELGDEVWLGGNTTNLLFTYTDLEQFDDAEACYAMAKKLHTKQGNSAWASVNEVAYVRLLLRRGLNQAAVERALQIKDEVASFNYTENNVLLNIVHGIALAGLGEYEPALSRLVPVGKHIEDQSSIMLRYFAARVVGAECLLALQRHDDAALWLQSAGTIATSRGISATHPAKYISRHYNNYLRLQAATRRFI